MESTQFTSFLNNNFDSFKTLQFKNIYNKRKPNKKSESMNVNNNKKSIDVRKEITKFITKIESEKLKQKSRNENRKNDLNSPFLITTESKNSKTNYYPSIFSPKSYSKPKHNHKKSMRFEINKKNNINFKNSLHKPLNKSSINQNNPFKMYNFESPNCANTIYSFLNKKQDQIANKLKRVLTNNNRGINVTNSKGYFNIEVKNRILSNYREFRIVEESPIVIPESKLNDKIFKNESEKRRYEKSVHQFEKLRFMVENDRKNSHGYILRFILKNGYKNKIDYDDVLTLNCFENFLNDLNNVDFSLPITEIIDFGLNYKKKFISVKTQTPPSEEKALEQNDKKSINPKNSYKKKGVTSRNLHSNLKINQEYKYNRDNLKRNNHSLLASKTEEFRKPNKIYLNQEIPEEFFKNDIDTIKRKNKLLEYVIVKLN